VAADPLLARVDALNVWTRGSVRAPHKPLLLLLALGRLSQGQESLAFEECEQPLEELLREFGPSGRGRPHPEYPFWHLQSDGLWTVEAKEGVSARRAGASPTRGGLRRAHAVGSFPEAIRRRLEGDPALVAEVAQRVLAAHFPESVHQDILDAVGLSLDRVTSNRRPRDPRFRARVLVAYEYRCALCGFDLRIGSATIGLDAAHIQWHQAGGPDTEANGVALCTLHHKVFDLGAFTIDPGHRVLVSELANGAALEPVLLRHHGELIRRPARPDHAPASRHLDWHRRQVFKGAPRFLERAG